MFDIDYLLAGKQPKADKFKTAESNNAEIINLQRLRSLLLGELTLESLKRLEKLTKEAFSKRKYVPAQAQALLQEPPPPTNPPPVNNDSVPTE